MTRHVFDDTSVLNQATGRPYGPGPLWAGTEPMDYPDPLCECGGPWVEGRCAMRGTLAGAQWELGQALRDLGRAIAETLRLSPRFGVDTPCPGDCPGRQRPYVKYDANGWRVWCPQCDGLR